MYEIVGQKDCTSVTTYRIIDVRYVYDRYELWQKCFVCVMDRSYIFLVGDLPIKIEIIYKTLHTKYGI